MSYYKTMFDVMIENQQVLKKEVQNRVFNNEKCVWEYQGQPYTIYISLVGRTPRDGRDLHTFNVQVLSCDNGEFVELWSGIIGFNTIKELLQKSMEAYSVRLNQDKDLIVGANWSFEITTLTNLAGIK